MLEFGVSWVVQDFKIAIISQVSELSENFRQKETLVALDLVILSMLSPVHLAAFVLCLTEIAFL